jgi:hypothetical protein
MACSYMGSPPLTDEGYLIGFVARTFDGASFDAPAA